MANGTQDRIVRINRVRWPDVWYKMDFRVEWRFNVRKSYIKGKATAKRSQISFSGDSTGSVKWINVYILFSQCEQCPYALFARAIRYCGVNGEMSMCNVKNIWLAQFRDTHVYSCVAGNTRFNTLAFFLFRKKKNSASKLEHLRKRNNPCNFFIFKL